MIFESTRGAAPHLSFKETILAGLASDGGLYVPTKWPTFSMPEIASMAGLEYHDLAFRIISKFTEGEIDDATLKQILIDSYKGFNHKAVAPLAQIDKNTFVLELFHGPTLAFKDFALQFLGRLLDHLLDGSTHKVNIVGATSGDTGSAAIFSCMGRKNINIFILHPHNRVSEVQRRMMTTIHDSNVFNLAVDGTFDDCQNIVKSLFSDADLKKSLHLTAVNSINWARIVAQVVYYFYAALNLGAPSRKLNFAVPTGNFGDVYAGYIAKKMGLPIGRLLIATNQNDILSRAINSGQHTMEGVKATASPSIDIQISSNFERILFEACNRDAQKVQNYMQSLKDNNGFVIESDTLNFLRQHFDARSVSEPETKATIANVYSETGYVIDPHTAVAVAACKKAAYGEAETTVCLATASPAKFPEAVYEAISVHSALPKHSEWIMSAEEKMHTIKADASVVKDFMLNNLK